MSTNLLPDGAELGAAISAGDKKLTEAEAEKARIQRLREVKKVLEGLPMGWSHHDPGKYGPTYRFLGPDHRPVVVRELLPEGVTVFEGTREEWDAHRRELGSREYDMVPQSSVVVGLDEVAKCSCPNCGTERPLIQSYHQTYDSPDGDEWQKQQLVLCCDAVQVIDTQTSEYRF